MLAEQWEVLGLPDRPQDIWGTLAPELKTQFIEDLTAVLQEIIYAHIRVDHSHSSGAPSLGYIRQSSPHQALTNQESLQMQYALREQAARLGWRAEEIEVIDTDLGLSGRAAEHRAGFKELAARVTLGQVGIILSTEVNRLSRNCSDWSPLLDSCGYRGCLIADGDGVYDPATANGRLLLGLKGTISEAELFTIRARLTAGYSINFSGSIHSQRQRPEPRTHTKRHEVKRPDFLVLVRAVSCGFVVKSFSVENE